MPDKTLWHELFGDDAVVHSFHPTDEDRAAIPAGMQETDWYLANVRVPTKVQDGAVGFLSLIFLKGDPRPAKEQIEERYAHGGGYRPHPGFIVSAAGSLLIYPGDPEEGEENEVYQAIAWTKLDSGELVILYDGSWVRIWDGNGEDKHASATPTIVRMD